jgi:transglutaminase-like putative cysteine protease
VAVLLLDDDFDPPGETWYLRQEALSWFDGHRLVPAPADAHMDGDVLRELPVFPVAVDAPPEDEDHAILSGSVSTLVVHPGPFGPVAPIGYAPRVNPSPGRFLQTWTFTSWAPTAPPEAWLSRGASDPPGDARAAYVGLPDDGRYRALAARVRGELRPEAQADPYALALALARDVGKGMTYDLSAKHEGVPDPAADFLFGEKVGYCVHTAHAVTYLLRALDVPARIGTGYAVPASDRRGGTLLIRNVHAHAWAEVWVNGAGWTVVDVVPDKTVSGAPSPPDDAMVRQLGEMARSEASSSSVVPQTPRSWAWPDLSWLPRALAMGAVYAGLAALLGAWGFKVWRRLRPFWLDGPALAHAAYLASLDRLTEAGLGRAHGETRDAHAARLATEAPSLAPLTRSFLSVTMSARPPEIDADRERRWMVDLAREVAAARPWYARLLGALDPTIPWRVR